MMWLYLKILDRQFLVTVNMGKRHGKFMFKSTEKDAIVVSGNNGIFLCSVDHVTKPTKYEFPRDT
jgi:hypothetical protein